jgi:diacylglycerol kinase family enzyme
MASKNSEPIAIIRNPNSTDAAHAGEAIAQLDRHGVAHIDFMTSSADFEQNVGEIQEFLESLPNEEEKTVISVAGDGTAAQVANAIIRNRIAERQKGKREAPVKVGFLGYGGFGDIDHAHDIHSHDIMDVLSAPTVNRYPLSVEVNGQPWRHVLAYLTLGFTALAAAEFATSESREKMQRTPQKLKRARQVQQLGMSYFKYKHLHLPSFTVNDDPHVYDASTDIIVANNSYIGGMIKPADTYYDKPYFGYRADINVSHVDIPNVKFGVDALLARAQFERAETMRIAFKQAANVLLHHEGELDMRDNVRDIFVDKNPADVIKTLHPRGHAAAEAYASSPALK